MSHPSRTLLLLSTLSLQSIAQNYDTLTRLFNFNIKFKMPQEALTNLLEVRCPAELMDSCVVQMNGKQINLTQLQIYPLQWLYHKDELTSFLYSPNSSDSVFVILDFYAKRLIRFAVYYYSDAVAESVKAVVEKEYYFYEHLGIMGRSWVTNHPYKNPIYSIIVSDTQAFSIMPSWCGTCNKTAGRKKSWEKLEQYLLK